MADQDPPVGPLHRLDPSEPDEILDLGRLEQLDPEAVSADPPAVGPSAPRPRDGLALAIALAVLLSLSSIAAIGGLVAISVRTLDPAPDQVVTLPIESAAPGPTIRVIEAAGAADPREGSASREKEEAAPAEQPSEEAVAPPPAPAAPPPAPSGGGEAADERDGRGDKGGSRRGPWGIGGAWCDATPGGTCDVAIGGSVVQPTDGGKHHKGRGSGFDVSGFLPTDAEDGSVEDLDDDPKGKHWRHGTHGKHGMNAKHVLAGVLPVEALGLD